jgi:hypothetical protein
LRPSPSVDTVWRILDALGLDWSALNPPAAAPSPAPSRKRGAR